MFDLSRIARLHFASPAVVSAESPTERSAGAWYRGHNGSSYASAVGAQPEIRPDDNVAGAGPILDFLRFEFKYVLAQPLRDRIERDIRHFMSPDPMVAGTAGGSYVVRSLYYDDPAFSCYHEKVDGTLQRAKFRLRTYTNERADACATYLEIKGRYNSLVFKHRASVGDADGSRRFADCADTTAAILAGIKDSSVGERFRYELMRKRLRPVMLIDYVRRPYLLKHESDFRLTMDEQLRATMSDRLFPGAGLTSRPLVAGCTVMEIKFASRIPQWFHRLIQTYGLERTSISKVCKGMEAWRLVPEFC